ncbi:pentapeptide repeat-containing protein, partial [uncultured Nostoc sp.]|uniref:pentapeptide repeat-containing protein n=1 Tax=uncultured Nostoc sp. TaxID=340711 RepID=UPI0035CA1E2A
TNWQTLYHTTKNFCKSSIVIFIIILRQGLDSAVAVAVALALALAFTLAFAARVLTNYVVASVTSGFTEGVASGFAGAFAGAFALALAFAIAFAGAFAFAIAFALAFAIAVVFGGVFAGLAAHQPGFTVAGDIAGAGAGTFVLLSAFIAWRAMKGDEKYSFIYNTAVSFASFGGTSFRNTNLTDANFTTAILKSTDFRKANLTRTCFHNTKKLDRVRPGTTYLQKTQIRQVLITRQGQEKNFDREDLRGINFQGANLVDASFIGADLSQANLQDADLSRAKLVQTQLNGTELTGAILTGAYIQDWSITTDTKFDGVRCEYVYMRLPTKENPDPLRKPDNNKEVFADGEFGDFIQPIFDTLDLYHNQNVDPRAIAISFKQLAENHPDAELEIVAMEKRGQDKFLLRAKTVITADKSELSAEYFDTYNEIKALPEREIKLLLAEKDNEILRLENMVMTALERPNFYSNTQVGQVSTMTNNPGGFSVGGSVGGDIRNLQGDNNRAIQGDNNQGVLGDNNQVTQQNQVGADTGESLTKEDVVKLLAQLETLIQGAELPADTKEEVIEDLSAAKKATDKEEPNKQRALERLGTVAETLEKTSKGVEAGQKVWTIAKPIIVKVATWLGVAAGSHLLGL